MATSCTPTRIGAGGGIRRYEVSAANVHDSRRLETLLDPANTGRMVRADSAYARQARETELRREGDRADIQHKGRADKPLRAAQQRRNHRIAKDRAFGEHPFARLANACARLAWRVPGW
ncbi:transposase [Xanthomonas theicola]|uniref:transposase n=1 Tax=Xanthomonas theicola TaxID=56464 RepID=UPI003606F7DD